MLDEHREAILLGAREVRATLRDELRDEHLTVAQCLVQFDSLALCGFAEAQRAVRTLPERDAIHQIRTMLMRKS